MIVLMICVQEINGKDLLRITRLEIVEILLIIRPFHRPLVPELVVVGKPSIHSAIWEIVLILQIKSEFIPTMRYNRGSFILKKT